jgi:hypothetical protein
MDGLDLFVGVPDGIENFCDLGQAEDHPEFLKAA